MNDYKEERRMTDKIEVIGTGTIVQHGDHNHRIYLMKLHPEDCPGIVEILNTMAAYHGYSKIFCKVPSWAAPLFLADGYAVEGQIPAFYNKQLTVFFLSKFVHAERAKISDSAKFNRLSELLSTNHVEEGKPQKKLKPRIRQFESNDAEAIVSIYLVVFKSYPFPIHDVNYILQSMSENVQYYGIEKKGEIVAIASAEVDPDGLNAEMTDFATRPEFRGKSMATYLLKKMEKQMKKQGIKCLYTIARLNSMAMNKTFLKLDYIYSGTLVNNTNISGDIESMNIYYKHI
jgi:putative beta-lysine N-acetyltransferase